MPTSATRTMTTQVSTTNLGNDRYLAARNAADGEDVGLLLIRAMGTAALALIRGGMDIDAAFEKVVSNTYADGILNTDVGMCIVDEVSRFVARND